MILIGNVVQNDITTRRRLRPTTTNNKMTDTTTGIIMQRDKDIEQTKYKEEDSTTVGAINYGSDNIRRVPEESDIKAESSYANNRRPIEGVTTNFESEENVSPTENLTPVSEEINVYKNMFIFTQQH